MRVNYTIVFVSDMDRSVAFYRDVIGLPMKFQSPGWTEFSTDGTTFALHLAEAQGATSPTERAGMCRPGFSVQNLDGFHQRMVSNDVPCIQEPKSIHGSKVAQYSDPDGLTFYVGEDR